MPHQCSDPTAEERRREVAKLLAVGLLRFHRRIKNAVSPPSESAGNCLDVPPETSLNAATGPAVNAAGDPEKEGTNDRG